jgi:hypothetical protein
VTEDWVSFAIARKRLKADKRQIEHLVSSGVLRTCFIGSRKGVALRYPASDIQRIEQALGGSKERRAEIERLRAEATRLKMDRAEWEVKRESRLHLHRLNREARSEEQQELERLKAEFQRITKEAEKAKAAHA